MCEAASATHGATVYTVDHVLRPVGAVLTDHHERNDHRGVPCLSERRTLEETYGRLRAERTSDDRISTPTLSAAENYRCQQPISARLRTSTSTTDLSVENLLRTSISTTDLSAAENIDLNNRSQCGKPAESIDLNNRSQCGKPAENRRELVSA